MFFKRSRALPAYLAWNGKMPAAATVVADTAETWIAGWATVFAVVAAEKHTVYEWSEFETGEWDGDARTLKLTFIDPRLAPLFFQLPADYNERIVTLIRERIDRSIVYQELRELPSGAIARGQVRRNMDESLFTQIFVDGQIGVVDQEVMNELENSLREAVGISYQAR
ncbi:MAG: hypothetical protein Q4E03_03685 [Trueperella sp.]|nr:hypothetical protein [Trueperella sp.]